ncbi:MAG: hypothetical protein LUI01_07980 [Firmicutes bacterium]|nr:hypothetical protein [Bacillota bacterium]
MPTIKVDRMGNSGAEEKFVQLFCDVYGTEKGEFVYLQHPFVDIYGNHRTIDFAIRTDSDNIAFEIDGETWHNPNKVSQGKYIDDLLKQNSLVHEGWKVFRWTDSQIANTPERVKDELVTFLGYSPALTYLDGDLPCQKCVKKGKRLLLYKEQLAQESLLSAFWIQKVLVEEFYLLHTQKSW